MTPENANPRESFTAGIFSRIVAPILAGAVCLAAIPDVDAARQVKFVEQLVADAVGADGSERVGRIQILVEEWSSDAELAPLRGAIERADTAALLSSLQHQRRRVGVVLLPGVQGRGARSRMQTPRNLLLAREVKTAAGRQVIAITDERLGLGDPAIEARMTVKEFNLIDIRFGADGTGIGKVATSGNVVFSPATGLLEAKDYATQPPRLLDVKTTIQ